MLDAVNAAVAKTPNQTFASDAAACFERGCADVRANRKRVSGAGHGWLVKAILAACGLALPFCTSAQTAATQTASSAQTQDTTKTDLAKPTTQQVPPVTTTVVVHGETKDNYLPEAVTVGTLDGATLQETPLSATVVTRDLLNDQVSRLLSDVVKNDASVGDDYVPVGYYGWYEIRGFAIDLATGLEINGMTIAGEQDVPLENKERVEILKGIAGVESGVAAAGGLIDFVTKRPAAIKALDLATDHRGSAYGAADVGSIFGKQKQVGARFNLGGERIASFMNDTNGWRAVGAGAADWRLTPKAIWKGDFEYQHKVERDGSGYQLLGGTTVPDIDNIFRSTMLGDQPWGPPDTYNTFNTNTRLDYSLPRNWAAFAAANYSHSLIEDNVIYAYGTPFDANGNVACPGAPEAPVNFFCPVVQGIQDSGGDYGIYDYRNPGELRKDEEAEALVTGQVKTGPITHNVAAGGEVFLRSVQQPGFYSEDNPSTTTIADGAAYVYLGAENIYQPMTTFAPPGNPDSLEYPSVAAGPRRLWEDSHQAAAILQDRMQLPRRIQLIAGGRYDSLHDHNYSAYASCSDFTVPGQCSPTITNQTIWLPFYAVTYSPASSLTLYGNYAELLSLGLQAPWWVDNASQFLNPFHTRQAEIGAKYEPDQRILLTTAFFRMRAPFFYPESDGAGGFEFVSQGRETHDGVEVSAEGKAASWLRLTASAAAMNAVSEGTGTPAFDNRQVINVPHLHTTAFADLTVPHLHGLHLMPGWSYSGRKEATRDDTVSVPSYNIFNLGARYTPGGEQGHVTFRVYANNIADKRYWSDTGTNAGDSFLWLGAPTTVRLSAHYTF